MACDSISALPCSARLVRESKEMTRRQPAAYHTMNIICTVILLSSIQYYFACIKQVINKNYNGKFLYEYIHIYGEIKKELSTTNDFLCQFPILELWYELTDYDNAICQRSNVMYVDC